MTTHTVALDSNASTVAELLSNKLEQKAKQIIVNIRSLENIDQQVMAVKKGTTVMCPW